LLIKALRWAILGSNQ